MNSYQYRPVKWRSGLKLLALSFFMAWFQNGPAEANAAQFKQIKIAAADTKAPAKPTILPQRDTAENRPVFKGTWDERAGNTLKVVVAGKIFSLGRDKQLTSDGKGNWTLTLTEPLSDGNFAILAETSDAFGNLSRSSETATVSVDTTKPELPTINSVSTRSPTPVISGTWPENENHTLDISLNGQIYQLARDAQLTSDSKGNWALKPVGTMADGSYDVVATVTDQATNKSVVERKKALVIDSTPPRPPTVTFTLTRDRLPTITGTWESSDAVGLTVSVAGQKFTNANQGEIEINGDHWSVVPTLPVADGTWDVVAVAVDEIGNRSSDAGTGELVVDGTSPATPTVRPVFGTGKRPPIGGTWDQDGQNSLSVSLAGKAYSLSKDGPLTSDGKGNWKLILNQDLQPGSYDVKVKVADRLGNQSNDVSNGEIWIKTANKVETPPATPVRPETPSQAACQKKLTATLAGQSIGFKPGKVVVDLASQKLLSRLAQIAKACPQVRIEVSGHTDSRGSTSYNQSLSEGRASAVVEALVARGVAKNRLRAVGYGEKRPIGDNRTKQGRAKNRRIEFRIKK